MFRRGRRGWKNRTKNNAFFHLRSWPISTSYSLGIAVFPEENVQRRMRLRLRWFPSSLATHTNRKDDNTDNKNFSLPSQMTSYFLSRRARAERGVFFLRMGNFEPLSRGDRIRVWSYLKRTVSVFFSFYSIIYIQRFNSVILFAKIKFRTKFVPRSDRISLAISYCFCSLSVFEISCAMLSCTKFYALANRKI